MLRRLAVVILVAGGCGRYGFGAVAGRGDGGGGDGGAGPACARLGLPSVPMVPVLAYASATGDFDGDGNQDLALGSDIPATFQIMLGNGNGTFRPGAVYSRSATHLDARDLNGDGVLDLIATGAGNTASIWLGNGDGTFRATGEVATSAGPAEFVIADFNGDSRLDLAVAAQMSGPQFNVSVLLGNGDGTFQASTTYLVGTGTAPVGIATGDLDGNGTLDLVTVNPGNLTVSVLLGTGTGTFGGPQQYAVSMYPRSAVLADLDRDGALDLAVAGTANLDILHGNGNGTFAAAVSSPGAGLSIVATDLNGDGIVDLVHPDRPGPGIYVRLGNGDGTFATRTYLSSLNAVEIAVADFDGNGTTDFVVNGDKQAVLLGNADGTLRAPARLSAAMSSWGLASADLDGDGLTDLITGSALAQSTSNTPAVQILLATSPGEFAPPLPLSVPDTAALVAVGDLDRDGIADLAVASPTVTSVFAGSGGGAFRSLPSVAGAADIAIADVDADGNRDLLTLDGTTNSLDVLRGNGDGTFRPALASGTGANPHALAIGDLDGNGTLDVVIANNQGGSVSVLRGNGDGTFGAHADFVVSMQPRSVALGDLDRDGDLDVVVLGASVSLLLGNGDGTLQPAVEVAVINSLRGRIALGDLDGDGLLDLMVTDGANDPVRVALGTGTGSFGELVNYSGGFGVESMLVRDLDRDGRADLVVGDFSSQVSVMLSRCLQ